MRGKVCENEIFRSGTNERNVLTMLDLMDLKPEIFTVCCACKGDHVLDSELQLNRNKTYTSEFMIYIKLNNNT